MALTGGGPPVGGGGRTGGEEDDGKNGNGGRKRMKEEIYEKTGDHIGRSAKRSRFPCSVSASVGKAAVS